MRDYPPLKSEIPFDRDLFGALWAGKVPLSTPTPVEDASEWKDWPMIEALAHEVMDIQAA